MPILTRREVFEAQEHCLQCKIRLTDLKPRDRVYRFTLEFSNGDVDTFPYVPAGKKSNFWTIGPDEEPDYPDEVKKEITFCAPCFYAITGSRWILE